MTVCGGPREENPMCVEENPTGWTVAAPGPGSVFILHFRSNNSLVHALLAVLLSFITLYHL